MENYLDHINRMYELERERIRRSTSSGVNGTNSEAGAAQAVPASAEYPASNNSDDEKNKGGLLGGIGYVGEKLLSGFVQSIEGIWDFAAGGIADWIGQDHWARKQVKNDWFGDWYDTAGEWFNPSEGWQTAGDVAGGIGTSVLPIATAFIPAAGLGVSAGVASLSGAGSGVRDAYKKSGKLSGEEWGYGALTGATEGVLETATNALGIGSGTFLKQFGKAGGKALAKGANAATKGVKSAALKSVAKTAWEGFAGEAIEEGAATFLSPYYARMTYDPNAESATLQEIAYSAWVGGLAGVVMGEAALGARTVETRAMGGRIVENGTQSNVLGAANFLIEADANDSVGSSHVEELKNICSQLEEHLKTTNGAYDDKAKFLIGKVNLKSVEVLAEKAMESSVIHAGANADAIAESLNALNYTDENGKAIRYTAEQLKEGLEYDKNGRITRRSARKALKTNAALRELVVRDVAGHLLMDTDAFAEQSMQGRLVRNEQELGDFIYKASDAKKRELGKILGIADWNAVSVDEVNTRIAEFMNNGGDMYYAAREQQMEEFEAKRKARRKKLYSASDYSRRTDGIGRYVIDGNEIGIEKNGDSYTIYDYDNKTLSRILSSDDLHSALSEYDAKRGKKTDSTVEDGNLAGMDAYAKKHIHGFEKLSPANKAVVRRIIRQGRAKGVKESVLIDYANVAARARIDVLFDKSLLERQINTRDGKTVSFSADAYYDPHNVRIVANPEAQTSDGILIHELDHAIRKSIKGGSVMTRIFEKAIRSVTEEEQKSIIKRYTEKDASLAASVIESVNSEAELTESDRKKVRDEINAYYAQTALGEKEIVRHLVAEKPTLKDKILSFFKKASNDYMGSPNLQKQAMKYYKQYRKWFNEFTKQRYGAQMGDAIATVDKGDLAYSFSSIAHTFFENSGISADEFESRDYKKTDGYKKLVADSLQSMKDTRGEKFNATAALKEVQASIDGIVRVALAAKRAGYDIFDSDESRNVRDSKKRLLFSSLEPNSDYFTSHDLSTICDKRKTFTEIYDEIVRMEEQKNVPNDKRFFHNVTNFFVLHDIMAQKGMTTPCRQCYVDSMRKNLYPMAEKFIQLVNETDTNNKKNDQLYSPKGEAKSGNMKLRERVLEEMEAIAKRGDVPPTFTTEMLTSEDGLAQLRLQYPLLYEAFNSFYGQSKPKMPKEAVPYRFGELRALLTDENGKIKQSLVKKINDTGGFRLQSYSDFQIKNYVDVLQVLFEAGTLGLSGHAYTKVPAFLEATEGTNLKRNISVFMYKDGNEWKIDRADSFPLPLEDIYSIVNSDESGNTSIIVVSQNDLNSAWIMANDNVGYGIPFHKSGNKMGTVRSTIVREGGREILGYKDIKDHTRFQSETWKSTTSEHKAGTSVKKPISIYDFWDFENKGNLPKKTLIRKNLKKYVDECEKAGYNPKFKSYLDGGKILDDTLKYAKELGFVPPEATVDDISFKYRGYTIPYGYYKFLTDFGIFKPNGKASPHEVLSLKNYDFDKAVKFFDDSETLRRNEILQQFVNGTERESLRNSDLTTEQLEELLRKRRGEVVEEALERKHGKKFVEGDLSFSLPDVDENGNKIEYGRLDKDYLSAVNRGDMETAQKMVDEAAKKAGYSTEHLYHGTSMFGFTNIDVSSASDDSISFFATNRQEVASGYMPWYEDDASDLHHDDVRRIGVPDKSRPRGLSRSYSAERILTEAQKVFPEYKDARVATDDEVLADLKTYWLTETIEAAEKLRETELSIGSNKLRQQVRDMCDAVIAASKEDTLDAWKAVGNRYKEFDSIDIPYDATDMRPQIFRSRILGGLQQIGKFAKTTAIMLDGKLTSTAAIVDSYNSFLGGETLGMYDLYTKQGNQLVIQGRGSSWNQLPLGKFEVEYMEWLGDKASEELSGKRVTTRDVAAFAKAKGYRSVAFYDIYDNGAYGSAADISDVYAFFHPNEDVKSADPVTYDDNGYIIPVSKRFDSSNPDIRFSLPDTDSNGNKIDYDAIIEAGVPYASGQELSVGEIRKIIANNVHSRVYSKGKMLKVVKELPTATYLSGKTLDSIADSLWQSYNSFESIEEADSYIHDVAKYFLTVSMREAKVEKHVAEDAQRRYAVLSSYIRGLSFTKRELEDIEHVKDVKGLRSILSRWGYRTVKASSASRIKTPIDIFITDVIDALPEFSHLSDMHPVDAFLELNDAYEEAKSAVNDKWQSIYDDVSDTDLDAMMHALETDLRNAFKTAGEKSKYKKLLEETVERYKERADYWKAAYDKENGRSRLSNIVAAKARKLRDIKNHKFANITQVENDTLTEVVGKLGRCVINGNVSVKTARSACSDLLALYQSKLFRENFLGYYDENTLGYYNGLIETYLEILSNASTKRLTIEDYVEDGEKYYNGFTKSDLKMLAEVMSYFIKLYDNYGKVWYNGSLVEAMPLAKEYVAKEHENVRLGLNKGITQTRALGWYSEMFADPAALVRRMDCYSDGFFTDIYRQMRSALIETETAKMRLFSKYDAFLREHKNYLRDASGKNVEFSGYSIPKIKVIDLYCSLKREQARAGLSINGFAYKDTKGDIVRAKGRLDFKNKYTQTAIDEKCIEMLNEIDNLLTAEDRQYIEIIEDVYNSDAKLLKTMRDYARQGFTNSSEGYYYPIRRANNGKNIDTNFKEELDRVSNASFNKDIVEGAQQELIIESADERFRRHVNAVCQYAYLSPVVDSYNVLFNLDTSGNRNKPVSIRTEARNMWANGENYFRKLVGDVQGITQRSDGDGVLSYVRGGYAIAMLSMNPKVWVTQLSSLISAITVIDDGSVLSGSFVASKEDIENIGRYCPLAELRRYENTAALAQGVVDKRGVSISLGGKIAGAFRKFGEVGMVPIQAMDTFVINRLFGACMRYVAKNQNLTLGTEANKIEAGKMLERVILETQQNSMATERSAAMRSGNEIIRAPTMFSADAMKTIGRVYDAVGEFRVVKKRIRALEDERKKATDPDEILKLDKRIEALQKQRKEANKKVRRSIASLVLVSAYMAGVSALFKLAYNKWDKEREEDETGFETFIRSFSLDVFNNLFGGLPFIRDAVSKLTQGYDIDNYATSSINDLVDSAIDLWNMFGKDATEQDRAKGIRNVVYSLSSITGLPTRNLYNAIYGVVNRISEPTGYKIDEMFYKKNYETDLRKQMAYGDEEMVDFILEMIYGERVGGVLKTGTIRKLHRLTEKGYKVLPREVKQNVTIDGEKYTLTESEYRSVKSKYSEYSKDIDELLSHPVYSNLSNEQKMYAVNYVFDAAYDKAMSDVIGKKCGKQTLISYCVGSEKLAVLRSITKNYTGDTKRKKTISAINAMPGSSNFEKVLMVYAMGYTPADNDVRGISADTAKRMAKNSVQGAQNINKTQKEELLKALDLK